MLHELVVPMFSMIFLFFLDAAASDVPTRTTVGCINERVSNLPGATFSLTESLKDIEWQIEQREKNAVSKPLTFDLSLADNYITDEGIDELCSFVKKFFHGTDRKLHSLSLANNRVTDQGALHLLDLLCVLDLKEVDLSINYINVPHFVTTDEYGQYQSNGKIVVL